MRADLLPRKRRNARRVSRPQRAFTLIEVLVVVAIIALLISILLPSLQEARRQAQVVACAANLDTIGNALVFYLQANQDYLPAAGGGGFELVHKYVQKVSTANVYHPHSSGAPFVDIPWFLCPGDEIYHLTSEVEHRLPDGTTQKVQYRLSYGMNNSLSYRVRPAPRVTPKTRKMSVVKRPAEIVSYCGAGDDDLNGAGRWVLNESNDKLNQTEFEVHHKKGNNFLFCDGHVQFHKVQLNNPPQYGLPPFPQAWIPNYKFPGEYDNFERNPPVPRLPWTD